MKQGPRAKAIKKRLEAIETQFHELRAERAGLIAELQVLEAGPEAGQLADADRTEAILEVLRKAAESLTPAEILRRLTNAGRNTDDARNVSATLNYLKKRELVQSPRRGQWTCTA